MKLIITKCIQKIELEPLERTFLLETIKMESSLCIFFEVIKLNYETDNFRTI